MGQRHQIFIKIINPTKFLQGKDYVPTPKEKALMVKQFGTGEFSMLAYHNQWLYGRSALQNALGLLKFASQFSKEAKTTSSGGYNVPFTVDGIRQQYNTVAKLTTALGFIMNFRPQSTEWLEAGIGGSFYIGETDEGINFDFTRGDNNDGITIIDLVENKYCFMNESTYNYAEPGELNYSVRDLPSLVPVSASEYVKAYYGETIATVNPYYLESRNGKKVDIDKVLKGIVSTNKKAVKGFENFEVLTLGEVQDMFTKMSLTNEKQVSKKRVKIKL